MTNATFWEREGRGGGIRIIFLIAVYWKYILAYKVQIVYGFLRRFDAIKYKSSFLTISSFSCVKFSVDDILKYMYYLIFTRQYDLT